MSQAPLLSTAVIDRLVPVASHSVQEIEAQYPARNLAPGAEVVRIAPSPTGFLHIGTVYLALISQMLARQTGGVYYLRMEDTDQKREVEGARQLIIELLQAFDLLYDEGPLADGTDKGVYGPYTQSLRRDLYQSYVRRMLEEGKAYPCFMTPEELEAMTAEQMQQKIRPGYYGPWAKWRDRSEQEVLAALDADKPFVIRFRSQGDEGKKRTVTDVIRGTKELPENNNDIVLRKRDGLPTYHLAHVVDDHLMHTTTVIRADEWVSSITLHMQLAEAIGVAPFTYAHIAPIQKMDGSSRRKLSKRKDPEANVATFLERGYPVAAVAEYLLTLANSNFEDWRKEHAHVPYQEFPFRLDKMQKNAGALFDLQKLDDISRGYLAMLAPADLYTMAVRWAAVYDHALHKILETDPAYAKQVFGIERADGKRKDLAKLSDIRESYGFFFDDIYTDVADFDFGKVARSDVQAVIEGFLATYDPADDQDTWFAKLKQVGSELGFTPDTREYRKNPEAFKGSVAEVAMVIRVALTGRNRSPNLYDVLAVMGSERVTQRLTVFSL